MTKSLMLLISAITIASSPSPVAACAADRELFLTDSEISALRNGEQVPKRYRPYVWFKLETDFKLPDPWDHLSRFQEGRPDEEQDSLTRARESLLAGIGTPIQFATVVFAPDGTSATPSNSVFLDRVTPPGMTTLVIACTGNISVGRQVL